MLLADIDKAYFFGNISRQASKAKFCSLPKSKQVAGAFLIRVGNNGTQYCLTVLNNNHDPMSTESYKHILLATNANGKFHICKNPDEVDYLFDRVEELISFYMLTTLGIHYHDTDTTLVDVFEELPAPQMESNGNMAEILNDSYGVISTNPEQKFSQRVLIKDNTSVRHEENVGKLLVIPAILKRSNNRSPYTVLGVVEATHE